MRWWADRRAGLALLLLALGWTPPAWPAGTVLDRAPSIAPGRVPDTAADPLELARQRWREGDAPGTVTALTPWLESRRGPWGRRRTAGMLLLGVAHMQLGHDNLASTWFYRVRRTEDPLAPWGAWYEALVDHRRGRHQVAIQECTAYRERFPDGPHADECLVLIGEAQAALGRSRAAVASLSAWLELHPDSPRAEEIELAKARAVAASDPERGIALLQRLVLQHTFPSTEIGAREALDELAAQGYDTTLPDDVTSRMLRAESLRRSGRLGEAWELFSVLAEEAERTGPDGQPIDPALRAWVDDNEDRFAWGTRRFDVFAANLRPTYEAAPDRRLGWRIFRAYARGGMWDEAADWGAAMLDTWGGRSQRQQVAWAFLHAGRFAEARDRFQELGRSGGRTGSEARFYAAFAALRDGRLEVAIDELGAIADEGGERAAAAAWWGARGLAARGDWKAARQWERRAWELDETGWYRLLSDELAWRAAGSPPPPVPPEATTATDAWLVRDGRWHGHHPASPVAATAAPGPASGAEAHGWVAGGPRQPSRLLAPATTAEGWRRLRWEGRLVAGTGTDAGDGEAPPTASSTALSPAPSAVIDLPLGHEVVDDHVDACTWYDPAEAADIFQRLERTHGDLLPGLAAAYDLARAGQAVDAGRILRAAWERWDDARGRSDPDSLRLQQIRLDDWRQMAIFARQPHLTYRLCSGLPRYADNDADELAAWKLSYPLVHAPELWEQAARYDVDPLLVMAIMRQESTYQPTVVSHAGAIGLVQIMPATGARVAALLGEGRYSPRDLEDPATNLRYGVYYLSLLIQRFGGAFPLAVASYNGGPHNVSRWLRPWLAEGSPVDLASFVEQIEYRESRDYVKRVTGFYDTYVRLYGPRGARVRLPLEVDHDDPDIVDF
ncbi:MAG: hypothetical protein D6798_04325 [Deltaproteobacteria bacterium]|nr:MAG: hypothetical protein D6798_04325 [Deltaproteobacteria bacterium]